MKVEIAVYKNARWGYSFAAECDKYENCDEHIAISEPMTVEFTMLPRVSDETLHNMSVSLAQKAVDEAQAKLEELKK